MLFLSREQRDKRQQWLSRKMQDAQKLEVDAMAEFRRAQNERAAFEFYRTRQRKSEERALRIAASRAIDPR